MSFNLFALDDPDRVIAVVLKNEIRASSLEVSKQEIKVENHDQKQSEFLQAQLIYNMITKPLFHAYANENSITVTDQEAKELLEFDRMFWGSRGSNDYTDEIIIKARDEVLMWKVMQSLHSRYGGRSLPNLYTVDPVDAKRKFIYDEKHKGSFKIFDKSTQKLFEAIVEPSPEFLISTRDFIDEAETRKFFKEPPWSHIKRVRDQK